MSSTSHTTTISVTPKRHPAQEAFINDKSPETAYVGGVGSGKTTGGVLRAARHISEWNIGHTGVIVSPTVPMLRNVIVPELQKTGLTDKPGIEYKRSENRIEYPNGSVIILESANNDRKIERLRGLNLAWAWMDEAAYQSEKVYKILNDRLRVGDYRNLFVTTTPKGFNWVYEEFGDIEGDESPIADGTIIRGSDKTAIVGVSTRANPANPEDYIEREERKHSGQSYRQEVEGEFVKFEGLIYDWFDESKIIPSDDVPEHTEETIYGLDPGGTNPSAIVCLLRDGDDWYAVEEYYQRKAVNHQIVSQFEALEEHWGPGPIYGDHDPRLLKELRDNGFNVKEADKSVIEGIRHVYATKDNLHVSRSCANLIKEFNSYQWKESGEDYDDKPLKQNDHLMDSLRYALYSHHYGRAGWLSDWAEEQEQ